MADVYSAKKRSAVMAKVKGRGNRSTEVVVARLFRARHLRGWRRQLPLPGRPDFAFVKERMVVFVDGCFWHRCPVHGEVPVGNREFWSQKLRANALRDRRVDRDLRARGWRVLRIWEHELKNPGRVASRVSSALARRKEVGDAA